MAKIINENKTENSLRSRLLDKFYSFSNKFSLAILVFLIFYTLYLYASRDYFFTGLYVSLDIIYIAEYFLLKKLDGEYEKIIKLTTFSIISFTFLTFSASLIAKFIVPRAFYVGSINTWIGFAGSILGGSITMLALIFTLQHEEKFGRRQSALNSIPLIVIGDSVENLSNITNILYQSSIDESRINLVNQFILPVNILNKSNFHASNIKYGCFNISVEEQYLPSFRMKASILPDNYLVRANEKLEEDLSVIPGGFSDATSIKFEIIPKINHNLIFDIELLYSDYLGEIEHITKAKIVYQINILKQSTVVDEQSEPQFIVNFTPILVTNKFIK